VGWLRCASIPIRGAIPGQLVANIAIIPVRQVGRDALRRNLIVRFIYFTPKCEIQQFVGNDLDLTRAQYVFERTGKLLTYPYWHFSHVD
jgi:hypothetical protein